MTDVVQTVVVGAGVVGLAIARELAMSGREVVVLESEPTFGTGTSSRNSEVIHAGIYYEPGSLKARLCVDGRTRLYPFCAAHGVAHRRCGKLIVATSPEQLADLAKIQRRAIAAGVTDLRALEPAEVRALEPELTCTAALLSPSTGIVDSHGVMLAFLGDAEAAGASIAYASALRRAIARDDGFELQVAADGADSALVCRELVNSAGLGAVALAHRIDGLDPATVPRAFLAKGNYFALQGRCPFSHLVYPIPNEAGLGVHLTLDLAGQGKFGPDVEWVEQEDYRVDLRRADGFYREIRRYWPLLPDAALAPAYAGMRPKIAGPGEPARDFMIAGPVDHQVRGLVNLFGIESPGLTSSLAIASLVRALLDRGRTG